MEWNELYNYNEESEQDLTKLFVRTEIVDHDTFVRNTEDEYDLIEKRYSPASSESGSPIL